MKGVSIMKHVYLTGVIAVSSLVFSGCGTTGLADIGAYRTGTEVTPAVTNSFTIGQTTKDDVRKALGAPQSKESEDGVDYWHYEFSKIRHFGGNVQETSTFEFDANGKLKNMYKTNGTRGATGNALLDAANGR